MSYRDLDEIGRVMYCDACGAQDGHEHCAIPNPFRLEQWMRTIETRLQVLERGAGHKFSLGDPNET